MGPPGPTRHPPAFGVATTTKERASGRFGRAGERSDRLVLDDLFSAPAPSDQQHQGVWCLVCSLLGLPPSFQSCLNKDGGNLSFSRSGPRPARNETRPSANVPEPTGGREGPPSGGRLLPVDGGGPGPASRAGRGRDACAPSGEGPRARPFLLLRPPLGAPRVAGPRNPHALAQPPERRGRALSRDASPAASSRMRRGGGWRAACVRGERSGGRHPLGD